MWIHRLDVLTPKLCELEVDSLFRGAKEAMCSKGRTRADERSEARILHSTGDAVQQRRNDRDRLGFSGRK